MPTTAEVQIAQLAEWLAASSQATKSPGGDDIIRGPYASIVPVLIDQTPLPDFGTLAAEGMGTLPLLCPHNSPAQVNLNPPPGQRPLVERIEHLIWKSRQAPRALDQGFPPIVLLGATTRATTVRALLNAAGLGSLDLASRAALCLPLYCFPAPVVARIGAGGLPVT